MLAHRLGRGIPVRHHDGWWWPDVWHVVFTVALIAVLVLLAVWLVTSIRRTQSAQAPAAPIPPAASSEDAALREARMRYARGEITREQYLQISEDLSGPTASG